MSRIRACACGDRSTAACRTSLADQHVVDVAALAAQEALVLDPLDPLAEQLAWSSVVASGRGRAPAGARSTDFTMFW